MTQIHSHKKQTVGADDHSNTLTDDVNDGQDLYRKNINTRYFKIKKSVHALLYPGDKSTRWSRLVNIFIAALIILTVVAVILETVQDLYKYYHEIFIKVELFAVGVFTIEYILRIWSSTALVKYKHPILGRIKYMLTPGSLIDLLAIIPFYLPFIIGMNLHFIMSLRILRFLRLLKLSKYMYVSSLLGRVFKRKKEELVLSFSITFLLIIFSSSVMYAIEHPAQPDKFSSIPETMWWAVSTLTTVGYGDVVPITSIGKFLTGIISLLGVGLFALPTGIFVAGFSSEYRRHAHLPHVCPHCGKEIDD